MDKLISKVLVKISSLSVVEQIEFINSLKLEVHKVSPFKDEPVDCVLWVKGDKL